MKGILLIISTFVSLLSFGQDEVAWDFSFNNETSAIEIHAVIQDGWHLYSQEIDNDLGPIPTFFEFKTNESFKLVGKTNEPTPIKEYDENFEGELNFFKNEVVFSQKIDNVSASSVEGVVTYMVCNDVMCMPPVDLEFTITIK